MAGRDISVTHEALGAVRVMRTGGVMGEVVGMAASLCKKHDCDPRCVYEKQLDALKELMRRGVGKASPDTKGSSASSPPFRHAFFVMENGVKDEKHPTAESQARVVKELGLDGMSVETGLDGIPERLAALDREGLSLFAIYTPAWLDGDKPKYDPKLPEVIKQLKGRPTVLWLTLQSVAHKPSTEEADAGAVEIVREVADLARESGIRIVLYPHAFFWMERAGDAVRIARKVDRKNVGMTFNLCHWLRFERPETLEARLQTAKPYLMHVTINGAEESGDNWERLIQPLGSGAYDVSRVLKVLKKLGYGGPVGLQCYGVKGDKYDNLKRSMAAWRAMVADVKPD
jgi:sugar phosphate isomerase/epimerase